MTVTVVSLFAGIGGFDLAFDRAGADVVASVEIDPAARSVLARQFPDTALFEDVTKVTADDLRAVGFVPERGVITAGFPCQDLSVAGRRAGLDGAQGDGITEDGPSYTLFGASMGLPAVGYDTVVRRLTELECERLQGFPDNWTAGQPGSARYRQLGNAVAVPVVEWIARRLITVHQEVAR